MKYMMSGPNFEYEGVQYTYGHEYDESEIPEKFIVWFTPAIPPQYANLSVFPETGESGVDYIAMDLWITYTWTGNRYSIKGNDVQEQSLYRSMFVNTPLSGIVDTLINLMGEFRTVSSGETGNYIIGFPVSNNHLFLLINSITGTGEITITGTSLSETTSVSVVGDTEIITVDGTVDQYYQSHKKWWEVSNIDISAGITAIDYDIGVVGYSDFSNTDYRFLGYRLDAFLQSNLADLELQLIKIHDDNDKKMSIVFLEKIGFDCNGGDNQIIDNLRTGENNRSYAPAVDSIGLNNTTIVLKQGDFETYFTADENLFHSSSKDEGFIIRYAGSPDGAITGVDWASLRIDYLLETA